MAKHEHHHPHAPNAHERDRKAVEERVLHPDRFGEASPSGGELRSGAPEAGGATTWGSTFGGRGWYPTVLRLLARVSRTVEALAYRKLRDLDKEARDVRGPQGRPSRARQAEHGFGHPAPA